MSVVERALRALTLQGLRFVNRREPPSARLDGMYPGGPVLLGHRGARDHALENTMQSFGLALALGADGVELDVHLSADGFPVVIHDDTVDRTLRATGRVSELGAAALAVLEPRREIDARYRDRLGPPWLGAPRGAPKLSRVLETMPDGAIVNVELKGPTPKKLGLEARVVEALQPHLGRLYLVVSSFHPAQLLAVRALDASVPIGLLVDVEQNAILRSGFPALALRPAAFHPPSRMVTPALVEQAHQAGMRVHVWGIRSIEDAARLIELGVDALMVDDVPAMAPLVAATRGRRGGPGRRRGREPPVRNGEASPSPLRGGPAGL